jgi:hypothetical protein
MTVIEITALAALFFVAAVLYSSVGHGGASAYLAAMALFGVAPAMMKPTALALNILVSAIAANRYWRAGHFACRLFLPLAAASVPLAYLGGHWALAPVIYRQLLGVVLLFAAVRLAWTPRRTPAEGATPRPPRWFLIPLGAIIGLISGATGIGGGIFLSPLLMLTRWADAKRTAAISAAFILVNSVAGLIGHGFGAGVFPEAGAMLPWAAAVAGGGFLGAELGSRRFNTLWLRRMLALVLVIAGLKLLAT